MTERTDEIVECVICNTEFDPTAAGGWCTNPECGEWRYDGDDNGGVESDEDEEKIPPDSDADATSDEPDGYDEPEGGGPLGAGGSESTSGTSESDAPSPESASVSPTAESETETAPAPIDPEMPSQESEPETPLQTPETPAKETAESETEPVEAQTDAGDDGENEAVSEPDAKQTETEGKTADERREIACPGCGETLHADVNFCPSCGEDVSEIEPEEDDELTVCPDCGESVDPEDSFCATCGENLDEHREPVPLTECPSCGTDIEEEDSFCAECGENLDDHRGSGSVESTTTTDEGSPSEDERGAQKQDAQTETENRAEPAETEATPESLLLEARGRSVAVSDGETVGRELRKIITETGGDEDDAVRVHREHIRFLREDEQFYLVNLGKNPTEVNGRNLDKGDRIEISVGDEITLSGVITLTVARP